MRPTRTPQPTARTRPGVLVAALATLALAGCGSAVVSAGGPTSSPSSSTMPTSTASTSTPAPTSPATTSPATLPRPVASGPASVVGTVREGVEPSCLVLGPYVLTGTESLPAAQQALLRDGATVAVTGEVDPGMASYCQQGTLLTVASVRALHPMTPDPRATPTVFTTP